MKQSKISYSNLFRKEAYYSLKQINDNTYEKVDVVFETDGRIKFKIGIDKAESYLIGKLFNLFSFLLVHLLIQFSCCSKHRRN